MKRNFLEYLAFALVPCIASVGCLRRDESSTFDKFQHLKSLSYFQDDMNPGVLIWKNVIKIPYGKTAELDARTIPTIWKSIKYSDEPEPRSILGGYLGDYTFLDIRHDPQHYQLFVLTSGSIWSYKDLQNYYIFCYDLAQRKVISRFLVPKDLFSRINIPKPGGLTSRSTRTPPTLPSAPSLRSASSAPLSVSVQAGPVSFFR